MAHVLVISDSESLSRQISELLQAADYRVTTVKGIHKGIALLDKEPFECVIIDYRLEPSERERAAEFFQTGDGFDHPPVLILYREGASKKLTGTTDFWADDYISQEEGAGGLLIRVRSAVRMKQLSDQARRTRETLTDRERELAALNGLAGNLTATDALTGLSNHSRFMEELKEVITISRQEPVEFSLLLIDLDNFSNINETLGYTTGDSALKSIASVFRENIREADLAARYRSDEFAVILYGCNLENSSRISEELRKKAAAKRLFSKGKPYRVTVSVGVAVFDPGTMKHASQVIKRATEALAHARRQGGNRVSYVG